MDTNTLSMASLQAAAGSVANYESFGRLLVEHALNTASGHVEKRENLSATGDKVTFTIPVTVQSARGGRGCDGYIVICVPGAGCFRVCIPHPV